MRAFIGRHPFGRWLTNVLLIGAIAALSVFLLHRSHAERQRDMTTRLEFCQEVEQVRAYARDAARRAKKALPTLSYYKHHPSELARAYADVDRQEHYFSPPLDCKKFSQLN